METTDISVRDLTQTFAEVRVLQARLSGIPKEKESYQLRFAQLLLEEQEIVKRLKELGQ
jgi:hypothetical protein